MKLPPPIFTPEPIADASANPLGQLLLSEESPIEEIEILLEEQLAGLHVTRPTDNEDWPQRGGFGSSS